ncbi:V-set domain-containing T-cell activation inhibitor 1-like isoform X2 [Triplophysa dalaica]|uniref:V-set domain-containing T-cell activation inhibitor 1-like isoform X2 n=1 Tax=Triplophysa dalaica TaxID=1582913 RepID=UPI0024DF69A3|nr:V-set domain-containing T-cell activation inhibitor 1-like isoform X2 [Triplophysa dalaica]
MTWSVTVVILAYSALLCFRGSSQEVLVKKVIAAPGSDAVLSCLFPVNPNIDFEMLVINWQHGDTVVHSFYRHRDQLEKQNEVYKGRTSLFQDQLQAGNASLMLTDIQPEHNGEYKCYVTCNNGPNEQMVYLLVAGYENTTLIPDSRGRYRLQSNMTLNLNSTETVRVEMSLDVLSQKFSRELTLHPHPACCEAESPRSRIGFGIALLVLIPAVLMLLLQRK